MDTECNCDHGPCNCGETSYLWTEEYTLRSTALSHAVKVVVAVNQTQAWVPIDTSLMEMFYDFLKGQSVADPGAASKDEAE